LRGLFPSYKKIILRRMESLFLPVALKRVPRLYKGKIDPRHKEVGHDNRSGPFSSGPGTVDPARWGLHWEARRRRTEERRERTHDLENVDAKGLDIATEVEDAGTFWPAEDYHQDYYRRTGKEPYCHRRVKRFE